MTVAPAPLTHVLEVRHLSKHFDGVRALDDVSLRVNGGTIHALVGENGAGKSTLMRVLAGLVRADAGEILFQGRRVNPRTPHDALRLGIAMIHQELMVFPELTVAENIFAGHEPASRWFGWLDRDAMRGRAAALLKRLGAGIPSHARLGDLSVAEMQLVEIARALAHRATLLIMDEPTASLSEPEVQALMALVRELQQQGVTVLYVSHRLDEIFALADTVTVLRDGRHVVTCPTAELTRATLIAHMVGRELSLYARERRAAPAAEVVLAVRGLSRAGAFCDVSLELHRGEVLGLAGLVGAGRTALLEALAGLNPAARGEIRLRGKRIQIRHPRDAVARGIALVTEDRRGSGLVLTMSVAHNTTLACLRRFCRGGGIAGRAERAAVGDQMRKLGIKAAAPGQAVAELSGGNQQKVVFAKALLGEPEIVLLDEPTRGVDVAAKAEIHRLIHALAAAGKAVLVVSSELPELLALADRILVMRDGTISAELDAARTSETEILHHAMPA